MNGRLSRKPHFVRSTAVTIPPTPAGTNAAAKMAPVAIGAEEALVQMRFQRDVSLSKWMGVVRENLTQARTAGLIGADLETRVSQSLPTWFSAINDRGYLKGDRLLYRVTSDSLRTVVVATDGSVLVARFEKDPGSRKVVLASYFAPGSDFREPLLRSLVPAP